VSEAVEIRDPEEVAGYSSQSASTSKAVRQTTGDSAQPSLLRD